MNKIRVYLSYYPSLYVVKDNKTTKFNTLKVNHAIKCKSFVWSKA